MCNDHSNGDDYKAEDNDDFHDDSREHNCDDDNDDDCKSFEFVCVLMKISISKSHR